MGVTQQVVQDAERITAQPASVFPALAERELKVAHRRTLDRELSVVPWRPWPVHGRHRLALPVAFVVLLVAPAVAEVDATDESNIAFGVSRMPKHDKFLMVRAAKSHSLVEQDLP